jgi:hypothetical protein
LAHRDWPVAQPDRLFSVDRLHLQFPQKRRALEIRLIDGMQPMTEVRFSQ